MTGQDRFLVFLGVWIGFCAVGVLLFRVNRDTSFKKAMFPWYSVFSALLFVGFFWWMSRTTIEPHPVRFAFFGGITAVTVLVTFVNIRNTAFCDRCGETLYSFNFLKRMRYCHYCGEKLTRR